MSTMQATVLRYLQHWAVEEQATTLTDGELLDRFLQHGDQHAFATVMHRHGAQVWGVCQRVLRNGHDAEDAFQATFLILAKKAASIRAGQSLGGWLYRVAYHTAIKVKAQAEVRREKEAVVATATVDPLEEVSARELLQVLDEEVASLPARLREPVVQCYLQGKTQDQAASELALSLRTLKRRLQEATGRLRRRLEQKGLSLSSMWLAMAVTRGVRAAVSTRVTAATMRAVESVAAGDALVGVSAGVVGLVDQVARPSLFGRGKMVATLFLLVVSGLISASVWWPAATVPALAGVDRAEKIAAAVETREQREAPALINDFKKVSINGQVVDGDGKPMSGVAVAVLGTSRPALRHSAPYNWYTSGVLQEVTTDKEGRFRLQAPRIPRLGPQRHPVVNVLAMHKGHRLGSARVELDKDAKELKLRLQPERLFQGQLIDLQGLPAAKARVYVNQLTYDGTDQQSQRLTFPHGKRTGATWPKLVTTDAHGRFTLRGLGDGWRGKVVVLDKRFTRHEFSFKITAKSGLSFVQALAPARLVTGTITMEDNGKPLPLAKMLVQGERRPLEDISFYYTQADKHGRFEVVPPPGDHITVIAFPPDDSPYLLLRKTVTWTKAAKLQHTLNFKLVRGVIVKGRVTEAGSGRPVVGASIQFEPYHDKNPFFRRDVLAMFRDRGRIGVSDAEGKYQLTVLPGPGHLMINGPTIDFIHQQSTTHKIMSPRVRPNRRKYADAFVRLDLRPEVGTVVKDVTLRRGVNIEGKLVGPKGEKVDDAVMVCATYIPYGYTLNPVRHLTVTNGAFRLPGCDPRKSVPVYFLDAKNNWGVMVKLDGKQRRLGKPIRLEKCGAVTVQFVGDKGAAIGGMGLHVEMVVHEGPSFWGNPFASKKPISDVADLGNLHSAYRQLKTDMKGRVSITGLIPGAKYRVVGRDPRTGHYAVLVDDLRVQAGQRRELGKIVAKMRDD